MRLPGQSEEDDLFTGDRADVMVQAHYFGAGDLLDRWEHFLPLFVKITPHPTEATAQPQDEQIVEQAALTAVTHEAHARKGAHSR